MIRTAAISLVLFLTACASQKKDSTLSQEPKTQVNKAKAFASKRVLPYTKEDWTAINQKIDQQKNKLWTCLPKRVTNSRLIVTVTANGRVNQVLIAEPKIPDNSIAKCILADMNTWVLPKTQNGLPMTLMIPMARESH